MIDARTIHAGCRSDALEFAGDDGVVRLRVGRLDPDRDTFGFELFDPQGKPVARLKNDGAATSVAMMSAGDQSLVGLTATPNGSTLSFGVSESEHFIAGLGRDGVFRVSLKGSNDDTAVLEFEGVLREGRRTALKLNNGKDAAINLSVDEMGALIEMLRDRKSAVRLGAKNGSWADLQLGRNEENGILLRLSDGGAAQLAFFRDSARLVLQLMDGLGIGFGVNHGNGKPAVRLGLSADGEPKLNIWDSEGIEINKE